MTAITQSAFTNSTKTTTSITTSGTGVVDFTNAGDTYTGATSVNGTSGTLLVDGTVTASPITVNTGGILGGTGTINGTINVLNHGELAPGTGGSPGTSGAFTPGQLTVGSTVTLQAGGTDSGARDGPTPRARTGNYSEVKVAGTGFLNLGSGVATVAGTTANNYSPPTSGNLPYDIIRATKGSAVGDYTGTFVNPTVTINNVTYNVNYGPSSDVFLAPFTSSSHLVERRGGHALRRHVQFVDGIGGRAVHRYGDRRGRRQQPDQ